MAIKQLGTAPANTVDATTKTYVDTGLSAKVATSSVGAANGVASLDGGGKVPVTQLPNSIMEYQGTWDASTNTPTLADGTGNTGDVYRVTVAGSQNLGSGSITFVVSDYAIYNGSTWEKADTTDAVASVNGYTGNISLTKSDVGLGNVDNTSDASKNAAVAALTNKDLSSSTNTFPSSLVDTSSTQTLSNKTLSAPALTGSTKVAQGGDIQIFNTANQTTDYERLNFRFNNNIAEISPQWAGTGSARSLRIGTTVSGSGAVSRYVGLQAWVVPLVDIAFGTTSLSGNLFQTSGTVTSSSASQVISSITPTINQSGTASYTGLLINPTETATGSGNKRLIDAQVGGVSKFTVDNAGNVTASSLAVNSLNGSNGHSALGFLNSSTPANAIRVGQSNSGAAPTVGVTGTDTDIGLNLTTKGTGTVQANGVDVVTTTGSQSLSNKTLTSPTLNTATLTSPTLNSATINSPTVNSATFTGTLNGVADAYTSSSGKQLRSIVLDTYPENSGFVHIPMLYNDLAYNNVRGGSMTVARNGVTLTPGVDYGGADNPFNNTGLLIFTPGATTDTYVITVNTCQSFYYGTTYGIVMGDAWRAKDVTIEVYWGGAWTTIHTVTNQALGAVWKKYGGNNDSAVTAIRFTLTNFNAAFGSSFRISSIFAIAFNSGLATVGYLPRGLGAVYGTSAAPPTLTATGSDTNISINLVPKGTGTVQANGIDVVTTTGTATLTNKTLTDPKINKILDTNGNSIVGLSATASAVNYVTLVNNSGTGAPVLMADGTGSSNLGISLSSKGSGSVMLRNQGNANIIFAAAGTSTAVNYLQAGASSTTGTPSLTATGSDTNISLNLVTTGTGTVQANGVDIVTTSGTQSLSNKTLSSPTLTTPVLGTPSSGTLTNCTGLPVGGISATGSPSSSTYLRGDGSWSAVPVTTGKAIAMAMIFG